MFVLCFLEGNDDPSYPRLELCFGGRRRFVGGSYVDFGKLTKIFFNVEPYVAHNNQESILP